MNPYDNFKKGLFILVKSILKDATFDRTYSARVKEKMDNGKYKVTINGNEHTAKSIDSSKTYNKNDLVHALAPQNNFKNLLIL